MFHPPRCPNPVCPAHKIEKLPSPDFYICKGSYHPKCRAYPVPRFQCRLCLRGFSRQTFREDYCDHKPHLNAKLFDLLASGLGLRQSGRLLPLSRRCVEMKARKISRHLGHLNRNLMDQFPVGCSFQMDEMETFENDRRVCPLSLPIVIEQQSMLVIDAQSAPIRPSGGMSKKRLAAIKRREKVVGPRIDTSRRCLRWVLGFAARYCKRLTEVVLDTDKKTTYPSLARKAFGDKLLHNQYSSKIPRDKSNPLFPINLTNAMARDLNGRLRRRSWLASKEGRFLDLQLEVFKAYRNLVRPRFNDDSETPAQILRFVSAKMEPTDVLSWRQDWGWFSIHPIQGRASIRDARAEERRRGVASSQFVLADRRAA